MTAKVMKFTIRDQAPAVNEKSAATTVKLVGKDTTDDAAVERAAETSLLVKLQNQQTSAVFDELFRRFAPKLKSYLISLGSAHDTAESVVQPDHASCVTPAGCLSFFGGGLGYPPPRARPPLIGCDARSWARDRPRV